MAGVVIKKHSELGIAAVILTILDTILWLLVWNSDILNRMGIMIYCWGIGLPSISLILSLGGLIQKERRKIIASVGIVLSIMGLGYVGLVIWALMSMQ